MSKTPTPLNAGKSGRTNKPPPQIVKVGKGGKLTRAALIDHPSAIEKIASIGRNTQAKLREIGRQANPKLHKRSK